MDYVGIFSCVPYLRACVTLRRGALLFLAYLGAVFHHCSRIFHGKPSSLLPYLLPFQSDCVPCPRGHVCRTFAAKRLQRSFQTVFRAVLCGLIVWCVHLHRLPYFVRLCSLIYGKFAVLGEYRGAPPKPKRREAQLRSHRILYFLSPKKFFLKNLLPLAPCLLKFFSENFPLPSCQNPLFS